jgi:hypothetical protein
MINWAVCVSSRLFPSVRYYTSMSGGNEESHEKKLSHYSRSAGGNLNPRPTEYDAVLPSPSLHTVYWGYNSADERVRMGVESRYKLPGTGDLQGGSGPGL